MIEQNGKWETRIAETADEGQRLDKWLSGWTELSRSRIRDLVETGNVRANGDIVAKVTTKVRPEIEYAVRVPPPVDDTPQPENIPLDILFEDDYLIVLNKTSGMTVHPAPGSRSATLVNALLYHCADSLSGIGGVMRPGIVHRLDKDTSGVMVVAKTDRAHQGLSKQFAKHSIDRIYTHYQYVKGYGRAQHASIGTPKISQLDCQLETGRTHQIRVHLSHIGCPLLGDPLYGKQRAYATSNQPAEEAVRVAVANFKRQALHARHLGFIHPITKEHHGFDAAVPPDMQHLLDVLENLPLN